MDSSTRLYTRLGEIPEDPNDPESLAELLVCAFGAFERYYVCWKTQGGEFRQDGYDLPPALKDWLYPTDGTTRDFATLQVVFGRGEEYFASDKNGKCEYKEPEVAKKPVEEDEKVDKPALRRARTVSFLRPLSDVSTRSDTSLMETTESRRSSAASSRRASRPPSLSFSRTSSAASDFNEPISDVNPQRNHQPALLSQWEALGSNTATWNSTSVQSKRSSRSFEPPVVESISEEFPQSNHGARSQSNHESSRSISEFKVPEGYMLVPIADATKPTPSTCTCGCHEAPLLSRPRPEYSNTGTQTENISPQPRTALRIDTSATSKWSSRDSTAVSQRELSPIYNDYPIENPIFLGRGMSFFSKPGYQLGDSLMSHYQAYEASMCEYQYEFDDDARERL